MKKENIDIDRLVNYETEYCSVIKKHKISGNELTGLCPFHDDQNPSFSVNLKTGKWTCHAEGKKGNFVDFFAERNGLDTKEAYKQILKRYGVDVDNQQQNTAKKIESYTLEDYSTAKKLPMEYLQKTFGLQTKKDRAGIKYLFTPYFGVNKETLTYRKRYKNKDFRWQQGAGKNICLYGIWELKKITAAGHVVLVEGESDTQAMWYMEFSTLGIPGASMMRTEWVESLKELEKIYIHVEPDAGGETFLKKAMEALKEGGFLGEVYKWSCKVLDCKDPSEVLIKYGKEAAIAKIKEALKNAEKVDFSEVKTATDSLKDAPVTLKQPTGWSISDKGIFKIMFLGEAVESVLICRTPILLTKRLKSIKTGEEKMEIAFKRDGEWQTAVYSRSVLFNVRGIMALADLGCTVTSENARKVVAFLEDLEASNIENIGKVEATGTFGWQTGKRFIPGHEKNIVLDIDPSQRGLAAAYTQNGSFEEWLELMKPHRKRDKFRFILAAGFAAPLLKIVKQRIFFVYNWGNSKGGKTAGMKAALSAWGDPERLMVNFNATQVGLERMAEFYCDLPLGIDERQLAGNNQGALEKIVYMIASGTGKVRGAKAGGLQHTQTWRTVALATGEEPLSTETSQTGVSTRVLEIYGGPFDDEKEASLMHQKTTQHYGWAGTAFVRKLIETEEHTILEKYEDMVKYVNSLSDGKSGSHVAGVAAVALADAMIDTWFFEESCDFSNKDSLLLEEKMAALQISEKSWDRAKDMARSIFEDQMNSGAGDVNENATQFIVDWILSNPGAFGEKAAVTPCLGLMMNGKAYLFPSLLNQALEKAGYSPRKTMKYLAEKELIGTSMTKNGVKNSVQKWFNGRNCKFIEFHLNKWTEAQKDLSKQMNLPDMDSFSKVPEDLEADLPFT